MYPYFSAHRQRLHRLPGLLIGALAFIILLSLHPSRPAAMQAAATSLDPQSDAYYRLEAASLAPFNIQVSNSFPHSVQGAFVVEGGNNLERARNFLNTYRDLYLQNDANLELIPRTLWGESDETVIFDQTYRGVKVYGAQLTVLVMQNLVMATMGGLLPEGIDLVVAPVLTDTEAKRLVFADLLHPESQMGMQAELVVYDSGINEALPHEPHLVWRVFSHGSDPWDYMVDAHTGEILMKSSRIRAEFDISLQDANGITAVDWTTGCYQLTSTDDTIADNDFESEFDGDADAENAFASAPIVYDFFNDTFGWDSFNDSGTEIDIYVHANAPNAQWVGYCDVIEFSTGFTSLEVLFHEFTHGISYNRSIGNWGNLFQPGALNESYSDIMSGLATQSWVFGDDRTGSSDAVRDNETPDKDRMSAYEWCASSNDNGCIHSNSTIFSHAIFLFSEGGTQNPFVIEDIGYSKARSLMWSALFNTPGDSSFADARDVVVNIAASWAILGQVSNPPINTHGFTMDDVCQVRNAFAAVELGDPDLDCDGDEDNGDIDDDGIILDDNCPEHFNPAQTDSDGDGVGDTCESFTDQDGDGIIAWDDNCPEDFNPDQTDANFNGVGEPCDPTEDLDFDNDNNLNSYDNCPFDYNPWQEDLNEDGEGDACDVPDNDGDLLPTDEDNCPMVANPDQTDSDGDGIGDVCDLCPVNADEVTGQTAVMHPITGELVTINFLVPDSDDDGIPDACDHSLIIGGSTRRPAIEATSGCEMVPIDVDAVAGSYARLPIWLGDPEPDWLLSETRVVLELEGLPTNAVADIVDSEGIVRARTEFAHGALVGEGIQVLEFEPLGGLDYTFGIYFVANGQPDQSVRLSGRGYRTVDGEGACERSAPPVPTPVLAPTALPTATVVPTLVPTITPIPPTPQPFVQFTADAMQIAAGQCTTVRWQTANINAVYFEGQPTVGESSQQVCPPQTDTFDLLVQYRDGTQQTFSLQIVVIPPDRDGDGLPDDQDRCPDQAGARENGGCPVPTTPPDRDGDGLPDDQDQCPDQPGPGAVPGGAGGNGCPLPTAVPDRDGDTVPDDQDRCPDVAGFPTNAGCPRGQ